MPMGSKTRMMDYQAAKCDIYLSVPIEYTSVTDTTVPRIRI